MTFYNVPDAPGVPPLLRNPALAVAAPYVQAGALVLNFVDPASADVTGDFGSVGDGSNTWGIFDDSGQSVIDFDTFLGIEYRNSTRISDYPLEQGSFENYNKVNNPFDVVVGLACGGDMVARTTFLSQAADIANSLDLYTIVTPEQTFVSCNVERYDYKRQLHDGVGIVTVNLYFKEIRVNAQSEFTNSPTSAPTVEQAQSATTTAVADNSAATPNLPADQVQNPASASEVSQGQTNAVPATPDQSAPAPGSANAPPPPPVTYPINNGGQVLTAPALTSLPTGYTQDPATGLIKDPSGKVDAQLSINQGHNYIGKD